MVTLLRIHPNSESVSPSPPLLQVWKKNRLDSAEFSNTPKRLDPMSNNPSDNKSKKKETKKELSFHQSLNELKGTSEEGDSLSFTFNWTKNKFNKEESEPHSEELPTSTKTTEHENPVGSSVGFVFHENDIRQGVTLDKLFGGEFKKINIFDVKGDSLNDKDIFPDPEGTLDSMRCKYQSYEILEAENEEEMESRQTERKKKKIQVQNSQVLEIMDKIQNKYKKAKSKSIQRKRGNFIEDENEGNNTSFLEHCEKKDLSYCDSLETKSMSPKFKQQRKKAQSIKIKKSKFSQPESGQESLNVSQILNCTRTNIQQQQPTSQVAKSGVLLTSSVLGNMKEDIGIDGSKIFLIRTKRSKTKRPLANANEEYEDLAQSKNDLPTVPCNRTTKAGNIAKLYMSNAITTHAVKAEEAKIFKKKLQRESQVMAEKIKMNEKEKMDRYSKMFKLNNQERINLLEIENNRLVRTQRNSTHAKNDKLFERKKLMNF